MSNPKACVAPPAVREGDTIAVVAPAGPVPLDRLAPGIRVLERHFDVKVADDIGRRDGFLAGSDERRAEEFNAALRDPNVRGIWAARGGYGCSRIVPYLDRGAFLADPIPIVGFSDITVLLIWALGLGVRSIHGPVLTQLGELGQDDVDWVLGLVKGQLPQSLYPCAGVDTRVEGRLVGGNLSLLAHLCGSPWAPRYDGALCILEDVGERPYALDRYMTQLLAQPVGTTLSEAAAVILGDFARCEEPGAPDQEAVPMLAKRAMDMGLPCGIGLPLGHGNRNRAFPFGGLAELGPAGLRLLEPATAL